MEERGGREYRLRERERERELLPRTRAINLAEKGSVGMMAG